MAHVFVGKFDETILLEPCHVMRLARKSIYNPRASAEFFEQDTAKFGVQ